jgi:hypothetical protein
MARASRWPSDMATASAIHNRANSQSDRDKSLKEDYTMRLHEFTNRKDYTLPNTETAEPSNPLNKDRTDDMVDDAEPRLRKQPSEKPAPPSTVSV